MSYLERLFLGPGPYDFVRESFIHIHAWLTEKRVNSAEAELLADMTRKLDWEDYYEKEGFVRLMEYMSERSSISEDMSWAEVVGLDWN